jgi:hypothetical protein
MLKSLYESFAYFVLTALAPFPRQKGCPMSCGKSGFDHRPKEGADGVSFFLKASARSARFISLMARFDNETGSTVC